MTANEATALFSEYVDGTLGPDEKDRLQAYLAANPQSAAELIQFERTISVLRRLPQPEPVIDMWAEFSPKLAAYLAEQKRPAKLSAKWADMRSRLSAGLILYTQALAERTCARFGQYLQDFENE